MKKTNFTKNKNFVTCAESNLVVVIKSFIKFEVTVITKKYIEALYIISVN